MAGRISASRVRRISVNAFGVGRLYWMGPQKGSGRILPGLILFVSRTPDLGRPAERAHRDGNAVRDLEPAEALSAIEVHGAGRGPDDRCLRGKRRAAHNGGGHRRT